MIGAALKAHLVSVSGINSLVSGRVYPATLPQNPVFPCITYLVVTEPRTHSMEGAQAPNPLVQLDAWGRTYLEANTLADAIVAGLDAFRGTMGGLIYVSSCLQRARRDIFEAETLEYRVSLDYSFWHN